MPTRIGFSTHYPDRMKELAGKPTRFPEKILKGIYDGTTYYIGECPNCGWVGSTYHCAGGGQIADTGDYSDPGCPKCFSIIEDSDYGFGYYGHSDLHPKSTTIRSNYDYWKSKEGQLIQPFFWAGKPYRSKQVVFCPEVRLERVSKINIKHGSLEPGGEIKPLINLDGWYIYDGHGVIDGTTEMSFEDLVRDEGFDHPDHFWMWFDKYFNGALLEFESAKQ